MNQDTVRPSPEPGCVPPAGWSLVLPLKPLAVAKSRLGASAGALRADLALAFALDTAAAALACPAVARVLVVTDDPLAAAELAAAGALVVPDEPALGLNAALAHGARRARLQAPDGPVAALSADLPALRPGELARVLCRVPCGGRAFLPDTPGVGTTLLAAAPGVELAPAFGGASRERHRASGARELLPSDVDSVRRDVDTGADLAEALVLGVGPRTAEVAGVLAARGGRAG
ncbi:2-phospho-L-lactate guanylyltransferase [Streptacidiphilus sp. ASG 303]|uniref:2-phospho-L-lactate guanylyltransferase n=1 Tax=Streptacidiphilus sp. ASG 303 TaxID=2896847 RepID=UPI001E5B5DD7|nr:2-phospho-L-lactate guanylyltransferase [Streptacidiphilus sp. ASG 303]MCD0484915.1 2-phospho-L-lactate guanylyltransferase [Streptacidiphilus sp. ASG 303]